MVQIVAHQKVKNHSTYAYKKDEVEASTKKIDTFKTNKVEATTSNDKEVSELQKETVEETKTSNQIDIVDEISV